MVHPAVSRWGHNAAPSADFYLPPGEPLFAGAGWARATLARLKHGFIRQVAVCGGDGRRTAGVFTRPTPRDARQMRTPVSLAPRRTTAGAETEVATLEAYFPLAEKTSLRWKAAAAGQRAVAVIQSEQFI
ncbi:hypothetical protein KCP73_14280 [Salmonella enterica subsp. enterica]|nr:hypothetical protein KCP73_14280 [Salmonella enterica subsp. enterica]